MKKLLFLLTFSLLPMAGLPGATIGAGDPVEFIKDKSGSQPAGGVPPRCGAGGVPGGVPPNSQRADYQGQLRQPACGVPPRCPRAGGAGCPPGCRGAPGRGATQPATRGLSRTTPAASLRCAEVRGALRGTTPRAPHQRTLWSSAMPHARSILICWPPGNSTSPS